MSAPRLLLVHGWGFGPAFWSPLLEALGDVESHRLDMGFFGPPRLELPPGPWVTVGHSLGALWLLREALPQLEERLTGFVSLGGFPRFDVPPGPTRAMRRGLGQGPGHGPGRNAALVLRNFYSACGLPEELHPDISNADPERLAEGLDALLRWDERERLAGLVVPQLALAAEDDAVVPPALSRASFPAAEMVMLPDGGHAFPVTRPGICARYIRAFLESI
ncbi:alpha/beta fold hydrolase [Fundidesulfovibrio agrisoli]|uniref:alpha/beta fold hydrolase n=1 Tax=Fundidesulfovibrio agrisoli TaxID=2922717 RepID=UPI001FADAADD|nr:alpha/beta fold hydrolase [Fundidesulfovibrio agrisoli]